MDKFVVRQSRKRKRMMDDREEDILDKNQQSGSTAKTKTTGNDTQNNDVEKQGNATKVTSSSAFDAGASSCEEKKLNYLEKKGDLFTCAESHSLAHCISADIAMGKGIAVLFKRKFGGVQELRAQGQKPGGLAVLKRGERYIYYLVTKEKYWNKPTYDSLKSSLLAMKKHSMVNKVKCICMPKIGCGLDMLKWDKVKDILNDVFKDQDITIIVYTL